MLSSAYLNALLLNEKRNLDTITRSDTKRTEITAEILKTAITNSPTITTDTRVEEVNVRVSGIQVENLRSLVSNLRPNGNTHLIVAHDSVAKMLEWGLESPLPDAGTMDFFRLNRLCEAINLNYDPDKFELAGIDDTDKLELAEAMARLLKVEKDKIFDEKTAKFKLDEVKRKIIEFGGVEEFWQRIEREPVNASAIKTSQIIRTPSDSPNGGGTIFTLQPDGPIASAESFSPDQLMKEAMEIAAHNMEDSEQGKKLAELAQGIKNGNFRFISPGKANLNDPSYREVYEAFIQRLESDVMESVPKEKEWVNDSKFRNSAATLAQAHIEIADYKAIETESKQLFALKQEPMKLGNAKIEIVSQGKEWANDSEFRDAVATLVQADIKIVDDVDIETESKKFFDIKNQPIKLDNATRVIR